MRAEAELQRTGQDRHPQAEAGGSAVTAEPSKHQIPQIGNDRERTVWLLPDSASYDRAGSRLRLDAERGEETFLSDEYVLPRQVGNPNANHVDALAKIELTRERAE